MLVKCTISSPSTNVESTLRILRILKARNSYLQNLQGQKLTLIMDVDLKKRSNLLLMTFRNLKENLKVLSSGSLYDEYRKKEKPLEGRVQKKKKTSKFSTTKSTKN